MNAGRWILAGCLSMTGLPAAPASAALSFEAATRMSDRIVIATVRGASGGSLRLSDGRRIDLGFKEPESGLVFTPMSVTVSECLFDSDNSCALGDIDVLSPGGTVDVIVGGKHTLRTWEVAGAPDLRTGENVLLFMTKRHDRFHPINDRAARVVVDRSSGPASVALRFASPRFLSSAGLESTRRHLAAGDPSTTRPEFIESVGIDRLRELISIARRVPQPTSGMRHAIPDGVDTGHARDRGPLGIRLRTGEVP
jgi:hypothetical protein